MSDTTFDALLEKRATLTATFNAAKEALAAVDAEISAVRHEQFLADQAEKVATLVPAGATMLLDGRDIRFLVNYTNDGRGSLTAAGILAAHSVKELARISGAEDVTVDARFFGDENAKYLPAVDLNSSFIANGKGFNPATKSAKSFMPAVNAILTESTSGKYVIVSDGAFTDDVAAIVRKFKVAAELSPQATFDFVVVNTADTTADEIVKQLKQSVGNRVNLVKVDSVDGVLPAAKRALKARLAEGSRAQPVAVQKIAAASF